MRRSSPPGLLQTTQQLSSAVGVAAIVSVYTSGAVPGQLVPGLQAAFLTSATFAALAALVALFALPRRAPRPVEIAEEELEAVTAEAA